MKKTFLGVLAIVTVSVIGSGIIFTAEAKGERRFVDTNNDEICDNYAAGQYSGNGQGNFTDENNDGICDNYATDQCSGNGQGNFTDENNDGICDNYATGHGRGNGHGKGCRSGCGR